MSTTERPRYRSVFISDVHLGSPHSNAWKLLRFLLEATCETLYIAGDLLDDTVFLDEWRKSNIAVLRHILLRVLCGDRVVYVPGNHDHTLRLFCGVYGALVVARYFEHVGVDGRVWVVTHGDELGASLVQWPFWLDRRLPVPVWELLRRFLGPVMRAHGRSFHERVRAMYADRDGVICGHVHAPMLRDDYANCGDWIRHCTAIVEHHDGRMELVAA